MGKSAILCGLSLALLIMPGLSGRALSATAEISASEAAPETEPTASAAYRPTGKTGMDSIIAIAQLKAITGVSNYQYVDLDEESIGGCFWSVSSATFTIEFRIHSGTGMDLFEDYRTAANPQSRVWLESPLWDTGIYYEIGDWDADAVALYGEDCYAVRFIPSAYDRRSAPELGMALLELLVSSATCWQPPPENNPEFLGEDVDGPGGMTPFGPEREPLFSFYNLPSDWPRVVPLMNEFQVTIYDWSDEEMYAAGYGNVSMSRANNYYTNAQKIHVGSNIWEHDPEKPSVTEGPHQVFHYVGEGNALSVVLLESGDNSLYFELYLHPVSIREK